MVPGRRGLCWLLRRASARPRASLHAPPPARPWYVGHASWRSGSPLTSPRSHGSHVAISYERPAPSIPTCPARQPPTLARTLRLLPPRLPSITRAVPCCAPTASPWLLGARRPDSALRSDERLVPPALDGRGSGGSRQLSQQEVCGGARARPIVAHRSPITRPPSAF